MGYYKNDKFVSSRNHAFISLNKSFLHMLLVSFNLNKRNRNGIMAMFGQRNQKLFTGGRPGSGIVIYWELFFYS